MALSPEERALIARAVRREPEAFSQLYVQFYEQVLRRVLAIVRDRYEAEDVTSEAFLRAWNSIARFEERDISILAWFCTIAERLAFKNVKNRRPSLDVTEVVVHAPTRNSPPEVMELKSDRATLKSALAELPELQRQVIARRFLDDLSYQELGMITGKPPGTIRVIQHRALKALRTILAKSETDRRFPPSHKPVIR